MRDQIHFRGSISEEPTTNTTTTRRYASQLMRSIRESIEHGTTLPEIDTNQRYGEEQETLMHMFVHLAYPYRYEPDEIDRIFNVVSNAIGPNIPDLDGNTPLMVAARRGRFDAAQLLMSLENINPRLSNNDGETAADIALKTMNFEIYDLISPGFVSPLPTLEEASATIVTEPYVMCVRMREKHRDPTSAEIEDEPSYVFYNVQATGQKSASISLLELGASPGRTYGLTTKHAYITFAIGGEEFLERIRHVLPTLRFGEISTLPDSARAVITLTTRGPNRINRFTHTDPRAMSGFVANVESTLELQRAMMGLTLATKSQDLDS